MDRVREAEAQEQAILYVVFELRIIRSQFSHSVSRHWAVSYPLVLPAVKLRALVGDETDSGMLNNIPEHPQLLAAIERARERTRISGV